MPSAMYKKVMESARRARREGLDVNLVAPPVGRLRDVFMEEYNKKEKCNWRERPPHCRNCWGEGELVTGKEIYPHRPDLFKKLFWCCNPCGAYVGTHVKSEFAAPLGLMATAEHRQLKSQAHRVFDHIWKVGGKTRSEAYAWLQEALEVEQSVHIGWSTVEELQRIVEVCNDHEAIQHRN